LKQLKHIFALAPDCHTAPGYSHLAWRRHIYEGLRPRVETLVIPEDLDFSWARQGHNIDLSPFEGDRLRTNEQLLERIRAAHCQHGLDAVISYCFAFDVLPEVVRETIRMGVPWINFFCDSTHMFEKVAPLAQVVSLNWFPESAAIQRYQALGVPFLCAPYAWNPEWLPDLSNESLVRSVAFIGLPTTNRITQIGWLRLLRCPVEIRGHNWAGGPHTPFYNPVPARKRLLKSLLEPNLGEKIVRRLLWPLVRPMARGPLSDQEFGPYVKDSLMILGLNQGKDAQGQFASYLKFRDMEFPGYGCCYLTGHNEDITRVFEVGKEVLTFKSLREAAELIRRMRKEPGTARRIGRAGRRQVIERHNWAARLKQLEEQL
jgi:spore maturation protein CgeB